MRSSALRWTMAFAPALLLIGLLFSGLSLMTKAPSGKQEQAENTSLGIALVPTPAPQQKQRPPTPKEPELVAPEPPPLPALSLDNRTDMPSPVRLRNQPVAATRPEMRLDLKPSLANLNSMDVASQVFAVEIPVNENPTILQRSPPNYPPHALRRRIEGYVIVEFTVSREGNVIRDTLKVVESTPPDTFDRTVLRSLLRWRFEPLKIEGEARQYRARQKIDFKLNS